MSRLRFHSNTDPRVLRLALGIAVLGAACSGCGGGGDHCGPGDAPETGLVASGTAVALRYGALTGGVNNDCPAAGAPSGVISLTIHGTQSDATGATGQLTLCIERPDLLATQPQALGRDTAGSAVHVVDVAGSASGCSFAIDRTQPITGTASATGLCGNGGDPAGFALTLDGALTLTRTCGAAVDSLPVALHGRAAVAAP
jgi:hypothetical protein